MEDKKIILVLLIAIIIVICGLAGFMLLNQNQEVTHKVVMHANITNNSSMNNTTSSDVEEVQDEGSYSVEYTVTEPEPVSEREPLNIVLPDFEYPLNTYPSSESSN